MASHWIVKQLCRDPTAELPRSTSNVSPGALMCPTANRDLEYFTFLF